MQNFIFHNPTKLIFGKDTISVIGEEIKGCGFSKILIIAGGGSIKRNGVYNQVVSSLKKADIDWIESWGVQPNPVLKKVYKMIDLAKKENVDAILAVGGGSVIDSAKSVAVGIYMNDVWDTYKSEESVMKAMPIFTVLTLSATGSEMNPYAVLTNEYEKKKWNISGPALYPRVSVIDPSAQSSLPWEQTVNGALDAIAHIMESYVVGGESETNLAMNESLLRTIIKMTDNLESDFDDYQSRANLAWAATLALNGITGAGQGGGDWANHGIEHAISAINPEVAHGAGLGVIFPAWIFYCKDIKPVLFKRWAKNVWSADSIEEGVSKMKEKIKSWGSAVTLEDLGIDKNQIENIADKTLEFGLTGVIKELTKKDIINILKLAYSE